MVKLDYFNVRGNFIKQRDGSPKQLWPQNFSVTVKRDKVSPRVGKPPLTNQKPKQAMSGSSRYVQKKPRHIQSQHLDELLQNGFSLRHLENGHDSVMHHYRRDEETDRQPTRHIVDRHDTRLVADRPAPPGGRDAKHKIELQDGYSTFRSAETDFQLLGICNQVEMLLNKQLLQPAT
jgi:hypothetical protein